MDRNKTKPGRKTKRAKSEVERQQKLEKNEEILRVLETFPQLKLLPKVHHFAERHLNPLIWTMIPGWSNLMEEEKTKRQKEMIEKYAHEQICLRCGLPGHLKKYCKNPWMCSECKEMGHKANDCPRQRCKNCGGTHNARNCPDQCKRCRQPGHQVTDGVCLLSKRTERRRYSVPRKEK